MPADTLLQSIGIGTPLILAFLLVLIRISSIFVFFPIPMMKQAPELPKIVFALTLSVALFPFWPTHLDANPGLGTFLLWALREAGIGLAMGLIVGFLAEGLTLAAQIISMQAGYSYATSIDPNSNADSGVLAILSQLMAGLLFFAFGFDRQIILALTASLESFPPGTMTLVPPISSPEIVLKLSSGIFSTALRISLPVAALLLIVDLTLALLSRINQQLQLLTVAFPVKMILTLVLLAVMTPVIAQVYQSQGQQLLTALRQMIR